MLDNNCWYNLNVKSTETALNENWSFPPTSGNYGIWDLDGKIKNIFTQDWIDYMSSIGLKIEHVMLFYRNVGLGKFGAHVDIIPPGKPPLSFTTAALNFVLQGEGSEMVWYKTPSKPKEVEFTSAKTPYIEWPISELEEADRVNIGSRLMVVRTNVPHTVEMGNAPRWCISIRLFENHKLSWEETINRLRSLNLIEERS